jgi:hypothetical protein
MTRGTKVLSYKTHFLRATEAPAQFFAGAQTILQSRRLAGFLIGFDPLTLFVAHHAGMAVFGGSVRENIS